MKSLIGCGATMQNISITPQALLYWLLHSYYALDESPMALDRSTHLPGGFQVRHRTLGVFQGSSIGLAFWHPSSHMPEYGLCRFATQAKGQEYVEYLSSPACPEPLDRTDLTVETFDHQEHERLINEHPQTSAWETPL